MTGLKDLLSETAIEARVYDVTERALAGGRRHRARRRLAAVGSVTVRVAAGIVAIGLVLNQGSPKVVDVIQASPTPAKSVAPQGCEVSRLAMPRGVMESGQVTAGDPTGRFLAGSTLPGPALDRLVLWDNGQFQALTAHSLDASIVGVNSKGHAIEVSAYAPFQSWVYHDGQWTKLKGEGARARAINSQGVIVGVLDQGNLTWTPVIWRSYAAEPELLRVPGADWFVQTLGIDDAGNIVGSVRKDPRKSIFEPLIWAPDGQAWQPSIPDFPEALRVSAVALHNGQVIIAATYSERVNRLYWNIDLASQQARSLDLPAGVERISANGWALQGTKASLLFGDTKLRLPNLPDGESPRFTSMSLDGRVIGGYESGAGVLGGVPVVWRCH